MTDISHILPFECFVLLSLAVIMAVVGWPKRK